MAPPVMDPFRVHRRRAESGVAGGLRLVPDDDALAKLAADYQHMVDDGLFLDEVESFDTLLQHCKTVQEKANAA
jgi:hypothetical protein